MVVVVLVELEVLVDEVSDDVVVEVVTVVVGRMESLTGTFAYSFEFPLTKRKYS